MKKLVPILFSLVVVAASGIGYGSHLKAAQLAAVQAAPAVSTPNVYELWQDTNNERVKAGLAPLVLNTKLNQSSAAKCNDMLTKNYWGHIAPDGTRPEYFVAQVGLPYKQMGENLAEGYNTDQTTIEAWMASPEHRANILKPTFTDAGYATCSFNGHQNTVVQEFIQG